MHTLEATPGPWTLPKRPRLHLLPWVIHTSDSRYGRGLRKSPGLRKEDPNLEVRVHTQTHGGTEGEEGQVSNYPEYPDGTWNYPRETLTLVSPVPNEDLT